MQVALISTENQLLAVDSELNQVQLRHNKLEGQLEQLRREKEKIQDTIKRLEAKTIE